MLVNNNFFLTSINTAAAKQVFINLLIPCKFLIMANNLRDGKDRNYTLMRSVMDYGMGILILGAGIFFLFSEKMGYSFNLEPLFRYFFGGLCAVYGLWRIYRGYKKNYYNND